jgi:hypothetical protein
MVVLPLEQHDSQSDAESFEKLSLLQSRTGVIETHETTT